MGASTEFTPYYLIFRKPCSHKTLSVQPRTPLSQSRYPEAWALSPPPTTTHATVIPKSTIATDIVTKSFVFDPSGTVMITMGTMSHAPAARAMMRRASHLTKLESSLGARGTNWLLKPLPSPRLSKQLGKHLWMSLRRNSMKSTGFEACLGSARYRVEKDPAGIEGKCVVLAVRSWIWILIRRSSPERYSMSRMAWAG